MRLLTILTDRLSGVALTLPSRASIAMAAFLLTLSNPAVAEFAWVERPDPMREQRLAGSGVNPAMMRNW
jgi:hypothetical protein